MILNRKHAPALLEYGYSLKERGALDEYFDLLYQSFDDGVWDKELLLTLFQECAQHSEVKRLTKLSRNLFSQRIPHLDVEFYEKVRELLFWSGLFNEALFYGLKAYSYQAHKQNLLSPLRKIFFALGNLPFGEYCHQTSRNQPEHEMSEVVIVVKPGMDFAGIHYKLQSLDPWSRLEMPFLFLPHQKNPRVELSHLSVSESLIFYPERSGTYELKLDLNLGKLVTRKMEIDPPGNPVTYRFMDYSFETTPEALKRLTPFHFLSSED
ncbi:hypothetical protein HOF92_01795 [bacterium]|nr:hypothetical protein [bacterium]